MSLTERMKHRDSEMVPRALVRGMFAIMAVSLALVGYATITDRPHVGVLAEAPVIEHRTVTLVPTGFGNYDVMDGTERLAGSEDPMGGFYGVIGRVLERHRLTNGASPDAPIHVVRRDNGHVAIIDPETEFTIELIGYGEDNIAAFANLLVQSDP